MLPRLYLISDRKQCQAGDLPSVLIKAIEAGCRMIQIRENDLEARELIEIIDQISSFAGKYGVIILINDRTDIALACGLKGVHLKETSYSIQKARTILKSGMLIGKSTHSLEGAIKAEKDGADFITFGPVFPTLSKLKYGEPQGLEKLKMVVESVKIPVFALGGINLEYAKQVLSAGAYGIALISAIIASPDPFLATKEFLKLIKTSAK